MNEICPTCIQYTLNHDARRETARCYNYTCGFELRVRNYEEYFNRFVISKLNWTNYCAQTPLFIRRIRNTLEPRQVEDE